MKGIMMKVTEIRCECGEVHLKLDGCTESVQCRCGCNHKYDIGVNVWKCYYAKASYVVSYQQQEDRGIKLLPLGSDLSLPEQVITNKLNEMINYLKERDAE